MRAAHQIPSHPWPGHTVLPTTACPQFPQYKPLVCCLFFFLNLWTDAIISLGFFPPALHSGQKWTLCMRLSRHSTSSHCTRIFLSLLWPSFPETHSSCHATTGLTLPKAGVEKLNASSAFPPLLPSQASLSYSRALVFCLLPFPVHSEWSFLSRKANIHYTTIETAQNIHINKKTELILGQYIGPKTDNWP